MPVHGSSQRVPSDGTFLGMDRVFEETLGCTLYVTYMGQFRVNPFGYVTLYAM